jgi:hypothetical protein
VLKRQEERLGEASETFSTILTVFPSGLLNRLLLLYRNTERSTALIVEQGFVFFLNIYI